MSKIEPKEVKKRWSARLFEFNEELGRRLASLDSGEVVDPVVARNRLRRKSQERRQQQESQKQ